MIFALKKFKDLSHQINVIKKGGGNRPFETLATLRLGEGATFYYFK